MSTTTTPDPNTATLQAVHDHHETLRDELARHTEQLIDAFAAGRGHHAAREALVEVVHSRVLPHLEAEQGLYTRTTTPQVALLVEAMEAEHRMMEVLIHELSANRDGWQTACLASALIVLFDVRAEQEDQLLMPALAEYGLPMDQVVDHHPGILGQTEK